MDLTDLIFEYPPLTIKSRSIVSPSGSLTYGLFSIVTKTRKSDRLEFRHEQWVLKQTQELLPKVLIKYLNESDYECSCGHVPFSLVRAKVF